MDIRVTFDRKANAAYVYLVSQGPGQVAETCADVGPPHVEGMINLDFDKSGRLIGVEVLNATRVLPDELLKKAERL